MSLQSGDSVADVEPTEKLGSSDDAVDMLEVAPEERGLEGSVRWGGMGGGVEDTIMRDSSSMAGH